MARGRWETKREQRRERSIQKKKQRGKTQGGKGTSGVNEGGRIQNKNSEHIYRRMRGEKSESDDDGEGRNDQEMGGGKALQMKTKMR